MAVPGRAADALRDVSSDKRAARTVSARLSKAIPDWHERYTHVPLRFGLSTARRIPALAKSTVALALCEHCGCHPAIRSRRLSANGWFGNQRCLANELGLYSTEAQHPDHT